MKPAVHEQRSALESYLDLVPRNGDGSVALGAILGALEQGSPTAKHAAARLYAYFEADGFARTVRPAELVSALLSDVQPQERNTSLDVRAGADLLPYLTGKEPVDAGAFAKITGIRADAAETRRLDALVADVAKSIGLDHAVGFANELTYDGILAPFAFLGAYASWERPAQPLYVGIGVKAKSFDDIDLLYRGTQGGVPPALRAMIEDFLALDERERIAAILVHEHLELGATHEGRRSPHRSAVDRAPSTALDISDRVREHLELYRQLEQQVFGPPP